MNFMQRTPNAVAQHFDAIRLGQDQEEQRIAEAKFDQVKALARHVLAMRGLLDNGYILEVPEDKLHPDLCSGSYWVLSTKMAGGSVFRWEVNRFAVADTLPSVGDGQEDPREVVGVTSVAVNADGDLVLLHAPEAVVMTDHHERGHTTGPGIYTGVEPYPRERASAWQSVDSLYYSFISMLERVIRKLEDREEALSEARSKLLKGEDLLSRLGALNSYGA